jgi:hypothetical protein
MERVISDTSFVGENGVYLSVGQSNVPEERK